MLFVYLHVALHVALTPFLPQRRRILSGSSPTHSQLRIFSLFLVPHKNHFFLESAHLYFSQAPQAFGQCDLILLFPHLLSVFDGLRTSHSHPLLLYTPSTSVFFLNLTPESLHMPLTDGLADGLADGYSNERHILATWNKKKKDNFYVSPFLSLQSTYCCCWRS